MLIPRFVSIIQYIRIQLFRYRLHSTHNSPLFGLRHDVLRYVKGWLWLRTVMMTIIVDWTAALLLLRQLPLLAVSTSPSNNTSDQWGFFGTTFNCISTSGLCNLDDALWHFMAWRTVPLMIWLCRQSAYSSITHSDDPQPTNSFGFSRTPNTDVNIPDSIENLTPTTLRSKRHARHGLPCKCLTNSLRVRRVRTQSTIL